MKLLTAFVLSLLCVHFCEGIKSTPKRSSLAINSFQPLDCCSSMGCSFPAGLQCCTCSSYACLACFSTPVVEVCGSGTLNSTSYPTCTLTLSNFTHCANICPTWIFTASLTSLVNFVNQNTPICILDECKLQTQLLNYDCCNTPDICQGVCANGNFTLAQVEQTLIAITKQNWVNDGGCLPAFDIGSNVLHSNSPILAWITLPSGNYEIVTIIGSKGFWKGTAGNGANDFYFQYLISDPSTKTEVWVNEASLCANYNGLGGKWTNSLYIKH